jgi:exodeoxyribonuclease VII small subunit
MNFAAPRNSQARPPSLRRRPAVPVKDRNESHSSLVLVQRRTLTRRRRATSPLVKMNSMAETQSDARPAETFEASLDELEKVVKELEAGDLSLERSIQLFERGMGLSDTCRKQLEEAETRVEILIRKEGKIAAEPFRPEKSEKA